MINKMILVLALCISSFGYIFTQELVYGEYFFDDNVAYGAGTPIPLSNNDVLDQNFDINVSGLPNGLHRLFLRYRDSNGVWSQTYNYSIYINHAEIINIVRGEYFFDTNVDYGAGQTLVLDTPGAPATNVNQQIDISNLSNGLHRLFIRFQDQFGRWSQTQGYSVYVEHGVMVFIEAGEYFIDELADYGQGTPINVDNPASQLSIDEMITVPDNLSVGEHDLYLRFRDNLGRWSHTIKDTICVGVVEGKYVTDQQQYCKGDPIFFENAGGPVDNAIYHWDLNGDGDFSDLESNGNSFSYIPEQGGNIVFRYQISSPICPSFQKIDSLLVSVTELDITIDAVGNEANGAADGFIEISVDGGMPPYSYEWLLDGTVISNEEDPSNLSAGEYVLQLSDANGCDTSAVVVVDGVVSTSAEMPAFAIKVFPNPASDYLQFSVEGDVPFAIQVNLYDATSRLLETRKLNLLDDQMSMDLTAYAEGVYWLECISKKQVYSEQIMIIR